MSDFDTGPPYGFYLRHNGTCPDNLIQCSSQAQWADGYGEWFNCCPENTVCVDNTCCPTDSGCKTAIESNAHCANNQTWDLYFNDGDYFCCEQGTIGYVNNGLMIGNQRGSGVACAEHWMHGDDYDVLVAEAKGTPSSSATPSATPTASHTANTSTSDSSSGSSSNHAGAIAGGVVGGCAGVALIIALAWFLMRRRRKEAQDATAFPTGTTVPVHEYKGAFGELPDNQFRSELSGSPTDLAHELPAATHR